MEQILLVGFVFVGALVTLGQVVHPHPHHATQEKLYAVPADATTAPKTMQRIPEEVR